MRLYLALVRWTSSFAEDQFTTLRRARERGHSALIAVWHEELMLLLLLRSGDRGRIHILVSEHHAADVIAALLAGMGFEILRLSSNRCVRQTMERAERALLVPGTWVVMAVDGPFGPAHVAKLGVGELARRTGLPVVPIRCEARSFQRGRTWDGRLYPMPANRVRCRVGPAISPGYGAASYSREELTSKVQSGLDALEESDEVPISHRHVTTWS